MDYTFSSLRLSRETLNQKEAFSFN